MVKEGWRCAVVYSSASYKNVNTMEAALHHRYNHCKGRGGLRVSLAQKVGAGGTGGTTTAEYVLFVTYAVDFVGGELLGEARQQ